MTTSCSTPSSRIPTGSTSTSATRSRSRPWRRGFKMPCTRAGGVPRRVRSDSLSAAVNNLSSDKQFATQYQTLLDHYGVRGHRINVRKPHENGDVESAHGHLKSWLDQALRLRGNRDFADQEEYLAFVRQVVVVPS